MSVLGCAPASLHPTYDYYRLGLDGEGDGQIAAPKRASPRGTKRSPCWHSSGSLLAASGRLGAAASGRYHVVIFTKRNPTKYRAVHVSVGLRSCVAAPNLRLLDTRFTGRLPRPLPVLPGLVQSHQRGLATTKRKSLRGTKRSPCWHSSGSLLAASSRLGGATSGRYHEVIFKKRNPTKCSRRFMSVLGCAPASLHPTYDCCRLGLDGKGDRQIAAPPSGTSGSRAVPAAGARNDEARVTARNEAVSLLAQLRLSACSGIGSLLCS